MFARILCSLAAPVLLFGGCGGDEQGTDSADCASYAPAATSPYRLPWHIGHAYLANPHKSWDPNVSRYAYDIQVPIGTYILATRAGTVVRVEESFIDGDHTPGHENHVYVQHADGTVARYAHLTNMGALVQVGDSVQQGQQVGLSGDTGNATGPHLHFDVTRSCCAIAPDYNELPAGETLPLSFSNSDPDSSCGMVGGVRYTALP